MKTALALSALLLASLSAMAQDRSQGGFSDRFTFVPDGSSGPNALINSWNDSDPANPPYPGQMGWIGLTDYGTWGSGSAINVPEALQYLNNGHLFLLGCDPLHLADDTLTPRTYTFGDGTHIGDTYTKHSSSTCNVTGVYGAYLNSNNRAEGFSVVVNYVLVKSKVCIRKNKYSPCTYPPVPSLVGGSGTITDTIINQ